MGWPQPGSSDPADTELLLRILDDRIAAAGDEEERTRFQKLRDTAAETGGNIVSEVLAAYLARVTGASS